VFVIDVDLGGSNMDEEGVEVNSPIKRISKEETTSIKGKVGKNLPKSHKL
jgi:hypothetical protein